MSKRSTVLMAALVVSIMASHVHAWDHPGHMTTAAIAFSEVERARAAGLTPNIDCSAEAEALSTVF